MITKECRNCHTTKPLKEFYKLRSICKLCTNIKAKEYLKTKNGLVYKTYSNQTTCSKYRNHPMPTYTMGELKEWLFSQELFHELYDKWVCSGFNRWLKPSCDRTDDYKGYSLDRLELMTWQENFNKGKRDQKNGTNKKMNRPVVQYSRGGIFIKEYYSMCEATRKTKVPESNICFCCTKKRHSAGGFIWEYADEINDII